MTRVAGIIGHPLGHSLSPVFQQAALDACGLDVRYERWPTSPEVLSTRIASLREARCLGANVTIPYKERVIPMLDELGGQSARVGAVNTIVNREGRLFGFNTDGPGLVAALRNEMAFEPNGAAFLLIGAGGAARGIGFALAEAGASRIGIWNRTSSRARELAASIAATGAPALSITDPAEASQYDVIVQCTSVGMEGGPDAMGLPFDVRPARPGTLAVDIVYAPERTPFLAEAARRGLRTLGGLPMLIYQGALAFELFTGVRAPVDVMFEAARRELAARAAGARK